MGNGAGSWFGSRNHPNGPSMLTEQHTTIVTRYMNKNLTNILSPVYRFKKQQPPVYHKPGFTEAARAGAFRDPQPPVLFKTLLAPKPPEGYIPGVSDQVFKVPLAPVPRTRKMTHAYNQKVYGENARTAYLQLLGANMVARAGRNFTRRLQAIIPTAGNDCLQNASLVIMKMSMGNTKTVPDSKCFIKFGGPGPATNKLISKLPPRAQKPAEDGFQYAFVKADGGTWKSVWMQNNEKQKYKYYTKRAMRFRISKRMPAISEKNEDPDLLEMEELMMYYQEEQKKRYVELLRWDEMKPEGDAMIMEGSPKPGRNRQFQQCPFHTRLYCSRRHTWLLRDFRSCPLCYNTYTFL